MRDIERRRLECLKRCPQFYQDNLSDLNSGITKVKFLALTAKCDEADTHAGTVEQKSGEGEGATDQKDTIRENLRDRCSAISKTAKGMEPDFDGIAATFKFQRGLNDADLLAKAQGFAAAAIPFETDFIAYNMSATFLPELNTEIANFESVIGSQTSATDNRVEAHADLATAISDGMKLKRTLDPMVRNKYDGDPGKIAAWASASHLEKAPIKVPPPPPIP